MAKNVNKLANDLKAIEAKVETLNGLHKKGQISETDFEKAKAALLAKLTA